MGLGSSKSVNAEVLKFAHVPSFAHLYRWRNSSGRSMLMGVVVEVCIRQSVVGALLRLKVVKLMQAIAGDDERLCGERHK
jgi:hypothetical protein